MKHYPSEANQPFLVCVDVSTARDSLDEGHLQNSVRVSRQPHALSRKCSEKFTHIHTELTGRRNREFKLISLP